MVGEALLASAVGAMLWVDKFQVLQIMVSRPLICGPLVGWAAGDARVGFACGIMFEFLWLRRPPVGGYVPPDVTFASVATAAVAALISKQTEIPVLAAALTAFVFLLPSCLLGTRVDRLLRLLLRGFAAKAEADQRRLRDHMVMVRLVTGAFVGFSLAFVALLPLILAGSLALGHLARHLTPGMKTALGTAYYAVPLVGVADLLVGLDERRNLVLFLLGFAVIAGGGFLLG
jgi:PTS system mannose-specific IIC component